MDIQAIDDFSRINPSSPIVVVGPTPAVTGDLYFDPQNLVRPDNIGTGGDTNAASGSGDLFGFRGATQLIVPAGYVSGGPLSGSATYVGETLASLGLDIGIYVWTWGTGATADSFTLDVRDPTSVEQSSWSKLKVLHK